MSTDERLVYMADQIARNFATLGSERAVTATADHIARFWDPRMKQRAFAMIEGEQPEWMSARAALAFRMLRDSGVPTLQTAASTFAGVDDTGLSDAG